MIAVRNAVHRGIDAVFVRPRIRRLQAELDDARQAAAEAVRLAHESARAVEGLLQNEIELKRELARLRDRRRERAR